MDVLRTTLNLELFALPASSDGPFVAAPSAHLASQKEMSVLEKQARLFFHLSRAGRGSRPWKGCFRCASTSVPAPEPEHEQKKRDKKPYYVTSPIFYVNAGERCSFNLTTDPDFHGQLLMSDTYTHLFSRTFLNDGPSCGGMNARSC
jgi:hypothetical protein